MLDTLKFRRVSLSPTTRFNEDPGFEMVFKKGGRSISSLDLVRHIDLGNYMVLESHDTTGVLRSRPCFSELIYTKFYVERDVRQI